MVYYARRYPAWSGQVSFASSISSLKSRLHRALSWNWSCADRYGSLADDVDPVSGLPESRHGWAGAETCALVRAFADCDNVIFAVAKEKGVSVLDLSHMFTGHSELFYDHVHTTPEGSEAIAKAVTDFLAHVLDKAQ